MKKTIAVLLITLFIWTLSACTDQSDQTIETQPESEQIETADGYEELGGLWTVGAIYYKNRLVDLNDVPALKDLYDSSILSFNKDGTFLYYDIYFRSGIYKRMSSGTAFLLKTERVYKVNYENETIEKEDVESADLTTYLVSLINGDSNSIEFNKYDSITGKAKAGNDPLYYVKSNQESVFIDNHKIEISDLTSQEINTTQQQPELTTQAQTTTAANRFESSGERNAVKKAKDYLDYTAFSYTGLIDQLKYEGFSTSEATYGADHCGADWFEQAARKAQQYLDYTSFSRQGLKDQLEYEGFTPEQAEYGVNQVY